MPSGGTVHVISNNIIQTERKPHPSQLVFCAGPLPDEIRTLELMVGVQEGKTPENPEENTSLEQGEFQQHNDNPYITLGLMELGHNVK